MEMLVRVFSASGWGILGRGRAPRAVMWARSAWGKPARWRLWPRQKENSETILTPDLDYGNLLAFSGEMAPSVIIFRLRNAHPDRLLRRLLTAWPEMEPSLKEGAIVVLEDTVLRVRPLPLTMET